MHFEIEKTDDHAQRYNLKRRLEEVLEERRETSNLDESDDQGGQLCEENGGKKPKKITHIYVDIIPLNHHNYKS